MDEENKPNEDQNQEPKPDANSDSNDQSDTEKAKELEKAAGTKALNGLFSELGVDNADDLKAIIAAKNKADKVNQSELENTQDELKKSQEASTKQAQEIADLQAQNAVLKAGVVKDHVEDVTILAQAKVSKGEAEDFETAVQTVLKNNPQFKGGTQLGPDGTAINPQNASNNTVGAPKISSNMSLDELSKAYEKNPNVLNQFMKS